MSGERDRRPALLLIGVLLAAGVLALAVFVQRCDGVAPGPAGAVSPGTTPSEEASPAETAPPTALSEPPRRDRVRPPPRDDAPPPVDKGTVLEVLVTDGGTPVAGAEVMVLPESAIRSRKAPGLQTPGAALAADRTGADGIATLRLAARTPVRVIARRGARVGDSGGVRPTTAGPARVTVALTDGLRVRGMLVAAGDRPIADARVSLALVGPYVGMGYRFGVGWTATTRADGRFDLGYLPAPAGDNTYVLLVRGEGFADMDADVAADDVRVEPYVVRVAGWVRVHGTVRRSDGRPAVGARVALGDQYVDSDERGAFEFATAPDAGGVLRVAGVASRGRDLNVGPFHDAVNDVGEIRLEVSNVIAGRVLDENGDPIVGVTVRCVLKKLFWRETVTDTLGRFEMFDVSALPQDIVVIPPAAPERRFNQHHVSAVEPGRRDLEIVLSPSKRPSGITVCLRLDPPSDAPISAAIVVSSRDGDRGFSHHSETLVQNEARAHPIHLREGVHTLRVRAPGRKTVEIGVDVPSEGHPDVYVVLTLDE